jgi:thioredoxin-like negative regulator of GroEL
MIYLTSENELKLDGWRFVYFYTTWMPFHKKMTTMISKVENKNNIIFSAVDADNFKTLCKRFSIEAVPTVLALKDGYEKKRINGLVMTSAFKSAFVDICNT